MGMFDALIPQDQTDLGNESYEEIVDSYCLALEDVESEIAGLESLSDAIDNAEAFATAIESCGGAASPALMQFGYAVDPSFGQLIGRECPSDFATENMEEFGSFALESIKTKLVVAWEAVKNFILRLWDKIQEFCRMVLRLFDRKKQRLEEIIKKCEKKTGDKANIKNPDKKKIKSLPFNRMKQFIKDIQQAYAAPNEWVLSEQLSTSGPSSTQVANKVSKAAMTPLMMLGWKFAISGGFTNMTKTSVGDVKEESIDKLGFTTYAQIADISKEIVALLNRRGDVEKAAKSMDKSKAEAESFKNVMSKFDDPADKDNDTLSADEIRENDKKKAAKLILCRRNALLRSKLIVTMNKEVNNCAASVIAIASVCGL